MVVLPGLVLPISQYKRFFFTKEDALPQIINEMLQLHSPILGHYPLLLGSVWYTAVSWYKVSKQFHIKV